MDTTVTLLTGKRILLGITGSIAAYKAVDLASKLTQAGAQVDVILTAAAQRFVTPLTLQAVTGRAVYTDLWAAPPADDGLPTHIAHVGLAERADLFFIAPATADTLARLAGGHADDLITITALAGRCPVLIAPAMDGGMYDHPATARNLATLRGDGYTIIPPETGRFASGLVGQGRLPETSTLIGWARRTLGRTGSLAGQHIVVTAGGTREPLDPVRYLTNRSSGKQGYALAQAALDAGAHVTLISAARGLPVPVDAVLIPVDTAQAMHDAVLAQVATADALIMAAAVADFRPATAADHKIKKGDTNADGLTLPLERTPDILTAVRQQRETTGFPRRVIGFAAETDDVIAYAQGKLDRKGLDLIAANDVTAVDAGFDVETNRLILIEREAAPHTLGLLSKTAAAEHVIARLASLLTTPPSQH